MKLMLEVIDKDGNRVMVNFEHVQALVEHRDDGRDKTYIVFSGGWQILANVSLNALVARLQNLQTSTTII